MCKKYFKSVDLYDTVLPVRGAPGAGGWRGGDSGINSGDVRQRELIGRRAQGLHSVSPLLMASSSPCPRVLCVSSSSGTTRAEALSFYLKFMMCPGYLCTSEVVTREIFGEQEGEVSSMVGHSWEGLGVQTRLAVTQGLQRAETDRGVL